MHRSIFSFFFRNLFSACPGVAKVSKAKGKTVAPIFSLQRSKKMDFWKISFVVRTFVDEDAVESTVLPHVHIFEKEF